jgi:two-component system OmpR family response regulator
MSAKPSILIVEDDAGVRDLIRTRLSVAGYDAHTAHNGVEAMVRLGSLLPDAMILDINMPEMDGFKVLEALRTDRTGPGMPVLVLTARHAAEDVKRALDLGAKDYLGKPFNENQLMLRIARLLRPQVAVQKASAGWAT